MPVPYIHGDPGTPLFREAAACSADKAHWEGFNKAALLEKGFVTFDKASRSVCAAMLESLNKHFQVDYVVDVIFGVTRRDNMGLSKAVRRKIIARF